jgi:hypothetical protein
LGPTKAGNFVLELACLRLDLSDFSEELRGDRLYDVLLQTLDVDLEKIYR